MKISYFNYVCGLNAEPAGALAKSRSYIRELKAAGHEIDVNWQSWYLRNVEEGHAKYVNKHPFRAFLGRVFHEPKKLLQNIPQCISILKKVNAFTPDIVLERLEYCYFAAAVVAKMKHIPLVVEVDAPVVYEYRQFYGRRNLHIPFLPEMIEMFTLRRAAAVFCISSEMKRYYVAKGIDPDRVTVTPNGCNPEMFYPTPRDPELEAAMNLRGQVVIGWVGSLYGWAGTENLIRLVEGIAGEFPGVSFMFVGGGKNEELFRETLHGRSFSDRVHLPGLVPHAEVNRYLSCMDIVLAPYPKRDFWYASSMKVFEYMGAGKAVVTSNTGQLNEIITSGENGMLYEAGDFEDLSSKVKILIRDEGLRKRIGEKAHADVLHRYTWEILAARMDAALRKAGGRPEVEHRETQE
ncbi:glycosyltransferase [bacterium]|nr:glycosyltransferase [bacterium]